MHEIIYEQLSSKYKNEIAYLNFQGFRIIQSPKILFIFLIIFFFSSLTPYQRFFTLLNKEKK